MVIILNNCPDLVRAVTVGKQFLEKYDDSKKDCLYVGELDGVKTFVQRTKTGLSISQWKD